MEWDDPTDATNALLTASSQVPDNELLQQFENEDASSAELADDEMDFDKAQQNIKRSENQEDSGEDGVTVASLMQLFQKIIAERVEPHILRHDVRCTRG